MELAEEAREEYEEVESDRNTSPTTQGEDIPANQEDGSGVREEGSTQEQNSAVENNSEAGTVAASSEHV